MPTIDKQFGSEPHSAKLVGQETQRFGERPELLTCRPTAEERGADKGPVRELTRNSSFRPTAGAGSKGVGRTPLYKVVKESLGRRGKVDPENRTTA